MHMRLLTSERLCSGLSDYSISQLRPIVESATFPVSVLQTTRNLGRHDDELQAYCRTNGITIQSWGPLASPILGAGFPKEVLARLMPPIDWQNPRLAAMATRYAVTVYQVALRWVLQDGSALVVGTGDPSHMADDARVFHFELSEEEMTYLSHLAPGAASNTIAGLTARGRALVPGLGLRLTYLSAVSLVLILRLRQRPGDVAIGTVML
jgi:diketogulonate reductase-like aldo/keto reductase